MVSTSLQHSLFVSRAPRERPPTTWTLCFELPWSEHLAHPPQAEAPDFLREETWFPWPVLPGYSAYAVCVHFLNSGPRPRTRSLPSVSLWAHGFSPASLFCCVMLTSGCILLLISAFSWSPSGHWWVALRAAPTWGLPARAPGIHCSDCGVPDFHSPWPLTPPHQDPGLWQPGFWSLWTPPTTGTCLGVSTLTRMCSWEHGRVAMDQFSSVGQSCLTPCDTMDCSMPGFPVHHHLLEFTQTQVHWVSDTIQPSHPLLPPSPPTFNLCQHQGLFKWVSSSHQVAKVLEFQFQHQFFQWIFRTDFL